MSFIETQINRKKIKYDILNNLFRNYLEGINHPYNKVNLFINLEYLLNVFYADNFHKNLIEITNNKQTLISLTPEIINYAIHYRRYFSTRHNLSTDIIFYYTTSLENKICNNYNAYKKKIYDKKNNIEYNIPNNFIKINLKLIDKIKDYLPDIYFINSKKNDPNLIPYYFYENYNIEKDNLNLFITNHLFDFQYVNFKNTFILYPNQEYSSLINKNNVFNNKLCIKENSNNFLKGNLLNLFFTLNGIEKFNINRIGKFTIKRTIDYIQKKIDLGIINESKLYKNIEDYIDIIFNDIEEYKEDIINNFNLVDLNTLYKKYYKIKTKNKIELQIINKIDNYSLMDINSKLFPMNNINLLDLYLGE